MISLSAGISPATAVNDTANRMIEKIPEMRIAFLLYYTFKPALKAKVYSEYAFFLTLAESFHEHNNVINTF